MQTDNNVVFYSTAFYVVLQVSVRKHTITLYSILLHCTFSVRKQTITLYSILLHCTLYYRFLYADNNVVFYYLALHVVLQASVCKHTITLYSILLHCTFSVCKQTLTL